MQNSSDLDAYRIAVFHPSCQVPTSAEGQLEEQEIAFQCNNLRHIKTLLTCSYVHFHIYNSNIRGHSKLLCSSSPNYTFTPWYLWGNLLRGGLTMEVSVANFAGSWQSWTRQPEQPGSPLCLSSLRLPHIYSGMSTEVISYLSTTYSSVHNPTKCHVFLEETDISIIFLFLYLPEHWPPACIPSPSLGL